MLSALDGVFQFLSATLRDRYYYNSHFMSIDEEIKAQKSVITFASVRQVIRGNIVVILIPEPTTQCSLMVVVILKENALGTKRLKP